ncbi:MAG: YbaK/EbsC family protein [Anaerobutyricum sp.]
MWRKRANKRVDLKGFRRQHGLRALSFASTEELFSIMELTPGAVTPLGILNDTESRVHFYLDEEFIGNKIGVHPSDNTATIWMQADDLMGLIQKHGNEAEYVKI